VYKLVRRCEAREHGRIVAQGDVGRLVIEPPDSYPLPKQLSLACALATIPTMFTVTIPVPMKMMVPVAIVVAMPVAAALIVIPRIVRSLITKSLDHSAIGITNSHTHVRVCFCRDADSYTCNHKSSTQRYG
jgi:hypothetical protein